MRLRRLDAASRLCCTCIIFIKYIISYHIVNFSSRMTDGVADWALETQEALRSGNEAGDELRSTESAPRNSAERISNEEETTAASGNTNLREENTREENAREEIDEVELRQTAFLNLERQFLLHMTIDRLVAAIENENSTEILPLAVEAVGRRKEFLKLYFDSQEQRDGAVEAGYAVEGIQKEIEAPQTHTHVTLHVWGVPFYDSNQHFCTWLENISGGRLEVASDVRRIPRPNRTAVTVGRSVVVRVKKGTTLPRFIDYSPQRTTSTRRVNFWHRGMAPWCNRCRTEGHSLYNCRQRRWETHQPQQVQQKEPLTAATILEPADQSKQPDQTLHTERTEQTEVTERTEQAEEQEPTEELKERHRHYNEIFATAIPFCSKADTFSNHNAARFTIGTTQYSSTEQYLFAERARYCTDRKAEKEIMESFNPVVIKRRGDAIPFPGGPVAWHKFAVQKLYEGNKAKYAQNKNHRAYLFRSRGSRLVEGLPDQFWACGFQKKHQNATLPTKWTGWNVFGDLLTALREEMLQAGDYAQEVRELVLAEEKKNLVGKRRRTEQSQSPAHEIARKQACYNT